MKCDVSICVIFDLGDGLLRVYRFVSTGCRDVHRMRPDHVVMYRVKQDISTNNKIGSAGRIRYLSILFDTQHHVLVSASAVSPNPQQRCFRQLWQHHIVKGTGAPAL